MTKLSKRDFRLGALALLVGALLVACGGGGGGGGNGGDPPVVTQVTVSGRITFDRVPSDPGTSGLDYGSTRQDPARGLVVEAVDGAGVVVASTLTNGSGSYAMQVPVNASLSVRVKAQLLLAGGPAWDFRVVDNTSGGLLYAIESDAIDTGASDQIVNLNAASGWDGASYTDVRAAAPFAIIDTVFDAVQQVLEADPSADFAPLLLNWSPLNRESDVFIPSTGEIITTAYIVDPLGTGIFILGEEDIDTDEYDEHVLAHEWGHYLEDRFSRTDSPGGPHSISSRLDPRLAFSEGWSNAFAGMTLDDPIYIDTFGIGQALGFSFDVENNAGFNRGWYNESSVHSVLYDIYDSNDDGVDTVSLGFTPIFDILTTVFADTDALTSIFAFIPPLKAAEPDSASGIDALLEAQDVVGIGMDIWATTETNDAGAVDVLPVYVATVVDGGSVTVCSNPQFGVFNGVGVRQFVRFDITAPGRYRFVAVGPAGSDPDLVLFRQGFLTLSESAIPERETFTFDLEPGAHVLEAYEFGNLFSPATGRTCIDVSVETT